MWADDYVQRMPANKLLTTPVFAVCIHTTSRKTGRGIRRCRISPASPSEKMCIRDRYQSEIFSYTYKKKVTLLVSKEWIHPGDRVLVIDDFLARGEALRGLCEIVQAAGAELVGIGCAVEKGFQGGGDKLRAAGVNLHSLAIIESAEPGNIVFREEA